MRYHKTFLGTIILIIYLFLLLILACSCVIGMGYLINKIYHLELFQSIIIVSIVSIGLILLWIKFSVEKMEQNDYWDDDDEDNEDDDVICPECGEKMAKTEIPIPKENHSTTGRNAPCPCGSGKKYKNCCGKS